MIVTRKDQPEREEKANNRSWNDDILAAKSQAVLHNASWHPMQVIWITTRKDTWWKMSKTTWMMKIMTQKPTERTLVMMWMIKGLVLD